jgi:hypothetical protein
MKWINYQDIKPKEGSKIIGYGIVSGEIYGDSNIKTVESGIYNKNGYIDLPSDAYYCILKDITHWMPLPEPPIPD